MAAKSCRCDREWKTGRCFHLSLRMRGRTRRSQTAPPSVYVRLSGETNPTWKSLFFSIEMTPIVGAKKCCRSFSSEDSKHQHRPISSFDLEQGHKYCHAEIGYLSEETPTKSQAKVFLRKTKEGTTMLNKVVFHATR